MQRTAPTRGNGPGAASLPTLILLFGGVLLGALDIAIVGPALPAIRVELGLDSRQAASIFSVYILFGLIGAPLLASFSDRLGRRRVFVTCLLLFGLGSVVVATAGGLGPLLAGRAIQAFGAGGTLPVASAVIADSFPVARRGRALGLIGAVFGLAFVIGPVVGGIFLQWSWRWLFVINLPLIVILVGMALRVLEDSGAPAPRGLDWRGIVLLATGLALVAGGASSLGDGTGSGSDYLPFLAFAAAATLFWLFWRVEQTARTPILMPRLLGSRQMQIVALLSLATGLVEATMVFLPTLAVTALDATPSTASFMLLPLIAALIAGSLAAGAVLDRIGARPVIQFGIGLTTVGLLLFALLPTSRSNFYAAGLAVGFGLASLLGAPLRYVALEEGGEEARGASQGLLTIFLSSGRLFGASMTGGVAAGAAAEVTGYRRAMFAVAVACGLAALTSLWIRKRSAIRPDSAEPISRS